MESRSLADRRILITGASSGIGHSLAKELAPYGSRLLLVARRQDALEKLAEEILTLGAADAKTFAGDVTDPKVRDAILQQVRTNWSAIDLLINNAGVSAHGRFVENSEPILRQIMEVNFFAATELTRQAIPLLRKGKDPLIVNVGSILGHRGTPLNSEYCASKFAMRGWSEAIRPELLKEGIELLLVSPGSTDTEFFDHLLSRQGPLPWGESKGIAPQQVARQIVRAIRRHRSEIYPNWRGRMLVMLNRFFPRLVDRLMQRYG